MSPNEHKSPLELHQEFLERRLREQAEKEKAKRDDAE